MTELRIGGRCRSRRYPKQVGEIVLRTALSYAPMPWFVRWDGVEYASRVEDGGYKPKLHDGPYASSELEPLG